MIERAFENYTDEELKEVYRDYIDCSKEGLITKYFHKEARRINESLNNVFETTYCLSMAKNQFFLEAAKRFFEG